MVGFILVFYTAKILPITFLILADIVRVIQKLFIIGKKDKRQQLIEEKRVEGIFIAGTIFFLTRKVTDGDWSEWDGLWLSFWHSKIWIEICVAAVVIVWFTMGGVRDVKKLLTTLSRKDRDDQDDGFVK